MVTHTQAANRRRTAASWWPSRHGQDDEAGALNEISPAKAPETAGLVREGRDYDLAHVPHAEIPTFPGRTNEVALSRSAFAARFQRPFGESPKYRVTRTRLVHAARMLRVTDLPLPEVAVRAGYASQFSFSQAFKRAFGLSPAYRGQEADIADSGEWARKIAPVGSWAVRP
jgi:AraC-like DNA-binding protein